MILVVGGIASGKRSFARALGYSDSDMSREAAGDHPVLCDAQELMRAENADAESLAQQLASTKDVVLCEEIGSGIVPLSREERVWRDQVGALSKELARHADAVVRMVCGIPQVLKGGTWLEERGVLPERAPSVDVPAAGAPSAETPAAGAPSTEAPSTASQAEEELAGDHPAASSTFFTNRSCAYFPCHEGVDERDFNCLFCYCPLYALGPDCGGNFTYTKKGRKNCKKCALPHVRENGAKLVAARYEKLAALASEQGRSES